MFLRHKVKIPPFILGGVQEFQKRGGTENLLGSVALSEAVRLLSYELPQAAQRMLRLREKFETALMEGLEMSSSTARDLASAIRAIWPLRALMGSRCWPIWIWPAWRRAMDRPAQPGLWSLPGYCYRWGLSPGSRLL